MACRIYIFKLFEWIIDDLKKIKWKPFFPYNTVLDKNNILNIKIIYLQLAK